MVDAGSGAEMVPLIGRRRELRLLTSALREQRSCLITGPAGIGKSRLIDEALAALGLPAVRPPRPRALHHLLVELAHRLPGLADRFPDLHRATSLTLKAVVLEELAVRPRCVVLEDLADAGPRMYRFFQQIYYIPDACLIVTAHSREVLGHLRKLLWDPREEIALQPLNRAQAAALFAAAASAFRLDSLDIREFRMKALAAARGNPGRIVAMCRLAGKPEYRRGRHIHFLPLHIDELSAPLP